MICWVVGCFNVPPLVCRNEIEDLTHSVGHVGLEMGGRGINPMKRTRVHLTQRWLNYSVVVYNIICHIPAGTSVSVSLINSNRWLHY